ncbi:arylsulfatase domain protein [Leptospira kirschneri str. 200801925]|nr:arylsulfatase domain protein [Leptospira kirschneri str. 200801925]
MADHTHHRYLDYYEDRNVPFLIYAPGKVEPALDETIASQLDIIPTVLGLVGKKPTFPQWVETYWPRKELGPPTSHTETYLGG